MSTARQVSHLYLASGEVRIVGPAPFLRRQQSSSRACDYDPPFHVATYARMVVLRFPPFRAYHVPRRARTKMSIAITIKTSIPAALNRRSHLLA